MAGRTETPTRHYSAWSGVLDDGCGPGRACPARVRQRPRFPRSADRAWPTPAEVAARTGAGRRVSAANNAQRLRCDECGKVPTSSGIALHQHRTGHADRLELQ